MNNDERKLWGFLVLVVAIVAFGIGYLLSLGKPQLSGKPLPTATTASASATTKPPAGSPSDTAEPAGNLDFTSALGDLQGALRRHPGSSERELIQQINAKSPAGSAKPCPFEWNRDEPELMIQKDHQGQVSLVKTLASCTKAVETFKQ